MILCPGCRTKHDINLARGQSTTCKATKADKSTCFEVLTHRNRVADDKKYDKLDFQAMRTKVKPKYSVLHVGRSKSAPPVTTWPLPHMSLYVRYVRNTSLDPSWSTPGPADILLPFKHLDILYMGLQGLIIDFQPLGQTPSARAHFDAITSAMTTPKKNQDITEAVGEAAAAMAAMTLCPKFELLWGFDVHSGAGIDQIWWNNDPANPSYVVVEAKGPNASLSSGALGNPPGYEQMEKLWIIDRLAHMRSGKGAKVANQILNHLALDITAALPNYGGASKTYHGCAATKGKLPVGTLDGLTVTAQWQADGMLSYTPKWHKYTFP